ncbi:MAG TPA: pre-peptidase C-terminal domain-containing protein [Kofleriaceae bacterium]|nr:pre-peptidase C-terminal domain-containing protein [Kofleriaceae bacterium]
MIRTAGKFLTIAYLVTGAAACLDESDLKPGQTDIKQDPDGKDDAWGPSDAPSIFSSDLNYKIAELPLTGEASSIPWASSYWPVYQDSINYKWDGAQSESTSAKYGRAFGVADVETAVSANHGIDNNRSRKSCTATSQCDSKIGESCAIRAGATSGYCIPTWWGICHAWSPASILLPEPKYPVTRNGVTFKVNDIKALVTLVHNSTSSKFVALRCNVDAENPTNGINFDNYGRPSQLECEDTNAATYHLLLTNYLGIRKLSFVEDRTYDDEVWNQPLRGYRIKKQAEITAAAANRLIGVTTTGGMTVNKSGTVAKDAWSHQGSFPVTAGSSASVVMTGTGDADLYVHFGAQPTASTYTCRPYGGTSAERCDDLVVPAGATQMFVSVNGYAASSNFSVAVTTGGSAPSDYQFNPNARYFYDVELEVDYIGESASNIDGNLGSTINRYTHVDSYRYVLEVDAERKIIGGEWVGASKTAHPDFLWLPTGVRGASVAGGKITYANVKSLLDESLIPPGGMPPGPGTEKTVNETGTLAKSAWKHYGPFNVAQAKTLTATLTGTGDVDLYVRKGAQPTLTSYDCRPYASGSSESCSLVGPGAVYVSVNGYATTSDYQLAIKYTEGSGTVTPPPVPSEHLNTTGSVAQGEMKMFQMNVAAGQKLVVRTTSSVDVDLYVQLGAAPTTDAYLARGYTESGNETVTLTASSSGTLFIGVHGYAAGSFTLRTAAN